MFITPAYAQGVGGDGGGLLIQLLPFILIFVIMYLLILRPQQRRVKEHREMVANLRRGDTVVTSGGMIGKITKVIDDHDLEVELSKDVKVRVVRSTISELRSKPEPAKDSASK